MGNNKTANHFALDFVNCQIVGTETSLKKAQYPGSAEYKEICELMEAHPRFKVATKKVKRNKSKQTYKALNFTFIEKYISIQPNNERIMQEYEAIKSSAKSLGRSVYPDTKRWFIERFSSEDKPFAMDEAAKEIENAAAQADVVA